MKQKIINFVENLSNEIRCKSLSTLESQVLDGLFSHKTYKEIAEKYNYEENYIGDIARELYGLIGIKYRVKVTRANILIVLEGLLESEPDDSFFVCHNIKKDTLFTNSGIIFNQGKIMFDMSRFWKFDAINKALIYKHKNPIVVNLQDENLTTVGNTLLSICNRPQISGEAFLELCKLLNSYFNSTI